MSPKVATWTPGEKKVEIRQLTLLGGFPQKREGPLLSFLLVGFNSVRGRGLWPSPFSRLGGHDPGTRNISHENVL